jgi:hypothetical protein
MEWTLEIVLVGLLLATLLQAIRLERALGGMKRDKAALEALISGFSASTLQAETGIQSLRATADGAGRLIETQIARSTSLKEDLAYLIERAERLVDQLDITGRPSQVQAAAAAQRIPPGMTPSLSAAMTEPRTAAALPSLSQAELELLAALRMPR